MDNATTPLRLTDNAVQVLRNRYLAKDEHGRITETPEGLFQRVAAAVAAAEQLYGASPREQDQWRQRFYNLMASLRFLPNSPTLMNAGRDLGMLSACFVLRIPDSIEGIFDTVKQTALIQKAGGGTGFSFDELRPTGDYIASSGGRTSGPISFWRVLSETTNAIQQGAFRRGANMAMMSLEHPDILKFLHAKSDLTAFTNYNVSVKISDAWMKKLAEYPDQPHEVTNFRTGRSYFLPGDLDTWQYTLADLVEIPRAADARARLLRERSFWTLGQLWREITRRAHATGEPGVAFMDRINRDNMTPHLGRIEATKDRKSVV